MLARKTAKNLFVCRNRTVVLNYSISCLIYFWLKSTRYLALIYRVLISTLCNVPFCKFLVVRAFRNVNHVGDVLINGANLCTCWQLHERPVMRSENVILRNFKDCFIRMPESWRIVIL